MTLSRLLRLSTACGAFGATAGVWEGWRSTRDQQLLTSRAGSAVGLGVLWGSWSALAPMWFPLAGAHNLERMARGLPPADVLGRYESTKLVVTGKKEGLFRP